MFGSFKAELHKLVSSWRILENFSPAKWSHRLYIGNQVGLKECIRYKQHFWLSFQLKKYFPPDHKVFYLKELNLGKHRFCYHPKNGFINWSLCKTFYKSLRVNCWHKRLCVFIQFKSHVIFLFLPFVSTPAKTKWELSFEKNGFTMEV